MHSAYQWVAVAVMLAEADYLAGRLGLPEQLPITQQDLKQCYVPPVDIMRFGGRLDGAKYSFSFLESERLCYITERELVGKLSSFQATASLLKTKAIIGTNDAYCIATNWLSLISFDVFELERTNAAKVEQRLYRDPTDGKLKELPIFDVEWWSKSECKVQICIDGRTKELIQLRLEDDSFSHRPARLINDREKLLAVPDTDFTKYSRAERSNLVSRFAAVNYGTNFNMDYLMDGQISSNSTQLGPQDSEQQQSIKDSK